jgi:hypothetical protein
MSTTKRRKAVDARYRRPARIRENVKDYLADLYNAQPTQARIKVVGAATAEAQRREAVEALLEFAREEIARTGGAAKCFQVVTSADQQQQPIWEFLAVAALQILIADDPVAALKHFLGRHQKRPPDDNRWRDFTIYVDVKKLSANGMSIRDACKEIGSGAGLGYARVLGIYLAERKKRKQQEDNPYWQQFSAIFERMGLSGDDFFGEIIIPDDAPEMQNKV